MKKPEDVHPCCASPGSLPSPWQFACDWYKVDEIFRSLNQLRDPFTGTARQEVPADVTSRKFAEWVTHQYRLAMNKGIEIGERRARGFTE